MTAPDQDEAADRATAELERRLRMVVPPSLLADPHAFAAAFVRWQQAGHWRCIPPPPNVLTARREGDPPTEEFLAAKAAITRKEDHA
jgi:hypothetical protein